MATIDLTKIHEVCIVSPSDSPSQLSLPLTFLDMFWLRLDPASRLFFYEFPEPNTDFLNIVLPKLKKSLSLTLRHYLPVAGHLTWPQDAKFPIILYKSPDGVSLTVAETQYDFHTLSGDQFRDNTELRCLLPEFLTSETQAPVITLQITLFPNIGFSIGYVSHHGVMDGKSVSMFMHSWAYICKNGDSSILPPELTPSLDRSFVEQQSELEKIYPRSFGNPIDSESRDLTIVNTNFPLDVMLGTFRLTRENIDFLKKSVFAFRKEKNLQENSVRVSTFTVSSSYAMVCLIKAKEITSEKAYLGINVDARGRLEPPNPSTYFGNCMVGCAGFGDTKDYLTKHGFAIAVENVNLGLASLNDGLLKLAARLNKMLEYMKKGVEVDMKGFAVAGSPRFELYKADFGWGRPKKVEMISIAKTGAFYLSDNREGNGGVEIGVGLNKHEAEVFNAVFVSGLEAC